MTRRRILIALLTAAGLGFGSFGIMVWRGTPVVDASLVRAQAALLAGRDRFAGRPVLLTRDDNGRLGWPAVHHLQGGIRCWLAEGRPLASYAGEAD